MAGDEDRTLSAPEARGEDRARLSDGARGLASPSACELAESSMRKRERGAHPVRLGSRRVLGVRVDATDYDEAAERILAMAGSGGGMTCVTSVHPVMEAWDDPTFARVLDDAELVTPDGVPIVWALRALGIPGATRVYGPDLTPHVCAAAAKRGVPVGFYGGTTAVLDALIARLAAEIPGLEIVFAVAPPMSDAPLVPDERVVSAIADSGVGVLFVGLGCPKQERWMAVHRDAVDCALVGVGAAFDFLAGAKAQAPAWMRGAGLEWLFRLAREPRRLFWRYARSNPRFALRVSLQIAAAWWSERSQR
jgi:N-acetylglucosaminyldiphosphoundecaprenol N-acetyl-beta-D-mannosaminyltransferase